MHRAASVKNNEKLLRFISGCRNMSSTVCRIILLLTLLPLSSGWQSTRNVLFGASKLSTSTLIYFVEQPLLHPQLKKILVTCFRDANLTTHVRSAVSEGNTFSIVANRDFKEGLFSL